MTGVEANVIVAVAAVLVSWIGAAFIAGFRFGGLAARLDRLESQQDKLATTEQLSSVKESFTGQLAGVKEDVAEIKGMFRMTLKDSP